VLGPGWPHFAIDSVKYVQLSPTNYNAIVSIRQKLYGAPALYNGVPLELSFFKANWSRAVQTVTMNGATATYTLNLNFNPIYCALNYDNKMGDASTFETKTIKANGALLYNYGRVTMTVLDKGADSSLIRVVHNFVRPDAFKSNPFNHKLSDQRYWKVEGIMSPGFLAKGKFFYNGSNTTPLDTLLTIVNGDSVNLFYRVNAADDWKVITAATKVTGGSKTGFIEIDTLKLGEYTFGNTGTAVSVKELKQEKLRATLFPNPARGSVRLEFSEAPATPAAFVLMSLDGKVLLERNMSEKSQVIELSPYAKGTYIVKLQSDNGIIYSDKLIVE
jgi:hypothetical protein